MIGFEHTKPTTNSKKNLVNNPLSRRSRWRQQAEQTTRDCIEYTTNEHEGEIVTESLDWISWLVTALLPRITGTLTLFSRKHGH